MDFFCCLLKLPGMEPVSPLCSKGVDPAPLYGSNLPKYGSYWVLGIDLLHTILGNNIKKKTMVATTT